MQSYGQIKKLLQPYFQSCPYVFESPRGEYCGVIFKYFEEVIKEISSARKKEKKVLDIFYLSFISLYLFINVIMFMCKIFKFFFSSTMK